MYTKRLNILLSRFAQESKNSRGEFRFAKQIQMYINTFSRNVKTCLHKDRRTPLFGLFTINQITEQENLRARMREVSEQPQKLQLLVLHEGIERQSLVLLAPPGGGLANKTARRWPDKIFGRKF